MHSDQITAFNAVMRELQNMPLTEAQLAELSGPLIDALGDTRRAAKILTAALFPAAWDWPAWYPHAKREGYPTIQQVLSERDPGPYELLKQMLKPELHATAQAFGVPAKKSASKDDIIPALLQSGPSQLQPLLQELLTKHREKQRGKIYLQVAEGVATRIMRVAHGQYRYKQMLDYAQYPHFSHWLFRVDDSYTHSKAPKRCRDLHGSILPHAIAANKFPRLPCERLYCCCDISIGTPESLAERR